jgi:hypothetical protein
MKTAGSTLDEKGVIIPVFQCDYCDIRSTFTDWLHEHETNCKAIHVKQHHEDEFKVGAL